VTPIAIELDDEATPSQPITRAGGPTATRGPGSDLTVEGIYGQGSTFTVRLPALVAEPEPVPAG
jgi:signal transduction histidine kinase